jgi:phenylpropionate dioxygenase-like ring-hydroxylating dioxygenase large terminal subunit
MAQVKDSASNGNGATEKQTFGDVRQLAAPLGLKEYWYPALEDKKVKKKPVGLKLLGEDLVFFRGKDGQVKSLWNVCPHRGGSLMHGDCHFEGTVSCPYHGWTFDGDGNVLAVLPEGPESKIPGKVVARKYPTVTLKGMVFVWMGEGEAVAPEEDIPPEMFDDRTMILYATEYWQANWQVALENGLDAHVPYVHRNAMRSMMFPVPTWGPVGVRNKVVNNKLVTAVSGPTTSITGVRPKNPFAQEYFPGLDAKWPKHQWRIPLAWLLTPMRIRNTKRARWESPEEWQTGHHLPSMFRADHRTDMYTRTSVPVTEALSRQIYFKAVRPNSWVGRWYERIHFKVYGRWMQVSDFSKQDVGAMVQQRYDTPEFLSSTDSHQVVWRRLILRARGMMAAEEAKQVAITPAEVASYQRQEEFGLEADHADKLIEQEAG